MGWVLGCCAPNPRIICITQTTAKVMTVGDILHMITGSCCLRCQLGWFLFCLLLIITADEHHDARYYVGNLRKFKEQMLNAFMCGWKIRLHESLQVTTKQSTSCNSTLTDNASSVFHLALSEGPSDLKEHRLDFMNVPTLRSFKNCPFRTSRFSRDIVTARKPFAKHAAIQTRIDTLGVSANIFRAPLTPGPRMYLT